MGPAFWGSIDDANWFTHKLLLNLHLDQMKAPFL